VLAVSRATQLLARGVNHLYEAKGKQDGAADKPQESWGCSNKGT